MDRPLLTFGWIFLAVGLCIGAWSLATPLGAAPDEPEHLVQAAAIVRGQFDGPQVPVHYGPLSLGKIGTVRVPAWVTDLTDPTGVSLDSPICRTASSCQIGTPLGLSSTRTITSATQFSNYPPLYYLIVGGPTLLATGTGALYGVRLLGVLLDSLLIALGIYLLVRYHGRPVLIGALIALTPSVLFFGSVVNSSGMEIAAGFATWCAGLCIVAAEKVSRTLIVWTSSAFAVLILCRPTSWVTALVILLVLGVLAGWKRCRQLVGRLRPLWTTLILALAVAGSFLLIVGTPTLLGIKEHPSLSLAGGIRLTLRLMGGQLRQTIGVFGWLDVPAPTWVIALWVVAIVALVLYALAVSQRARPRAAVARVGRLCVPISLRDVSAQHVWVRIGRGATGFRWPWAFPWSPLPSSLRSSDRGWSGSASSWPGLSLVRSSPRSTCTTVIRSGPGPRRCGRRLEVLR